MRVTASPPFTAPPPVPHPLLAQAIGLPGFGSGTIAAAALIQTIPVRAGAQAASPAAPSSGPLLAPASPTTGATATAAAPAVTIWQRVVENSDRIGDGASLLSAGFDLGADQFGGAAQFGLLSSGVSTAANGVALAATIDKLARGDDDALLPAVATGFKFTGGTLGIAGHYLFPHNPYLLPLAGLCSIGAALVKVAAPGKD